MNTDQIVSESEWTMESVGDFHLLLNEHQREEIAKHHNAAIKSAIEKARQQWDADRMAGAARGALKGAEMRARIRELESRAAHASDEEQQEGHPQEYGDS